jgi:DNA-directed RNA polymerase subunit beta'
VILGHLIPAGTGFNQFQQSEVRIRPQALEALAREKDDVLARSFPLLESATPTGDGQERKPAAPAAGGLDALLGSGDDE